jgi:hypothetical protein
MRDLLRCRRGSVAFATVIVLLPLMGVVALGAEATSWYVTKQQAQNAADAAAYSGGLWLACSLGASCTDPASQTLDYRAREFAAQNGFCKTGDTNSYPGSPCTSLPSGTTQDVTITPIGTNEVRATVSQKQPAYLTQLLGLSTVTIGATAVAQVFQLSNPCVLALKDNLHFQGSPTINSPNCGLASNNTLSNSIDFTGNRGINLSNAGTISGSGGCHQTGGTQCSLPKVHTSISPAIDPLSAFNVAMSSLSTASFSNACPSPPQPYTAANKCYNLVGNGHGAFSFGNQSYALPNGVYFFSGSLIINGGATITSSACTPQTTPPCGVTWILLPGSTLTINGNPTIQITASVNVLSTQVPAALASFVSQMSQLLIYDPESGNVKISGSSTSYFNGITYVPNGDLTYQGNTTQNYPCVEVIAKGINLLGNSNFDNTQCPASDQLKSQIVRLVE